MDIRLVVGLVAPFVKEAIFGRNIDPDEEKNKQRSLAQKVTDFFMGSVRATSFLIIFAMLTFFISVVSVRKLSHLAVTRETAQKTTQVVEPKPQQRQKPKDDVPVPPLTPGSIEASSVEESRKRILQHLRTK